VVDLAESTPPLAIAGTEVVRIDGPRQWLRFHRDEHSAAELISRVAATAPLLDISVEEPDIEEVIRHVYRDSAA
jgi:ABC-2 type transport system ATP-binding protein